MKSTMRSIVARSVVLCAAALLCLLPLVLVTGCGSKDDTADAKPAISVDKSIENIQNDPKMPQQAKDAAIAAIKSHPGGADTPKGDTTGK